MQINCIGEIQSTFYNNFDNQKLQNKHDFRLFEKHTDYQYNSRSYFSSDKYLELKNYVKKYDLSAQKTNDKTLNFVKNARSKFIKEFGNVKSSSMQDLVLNRKSKSYDNNLNTEINNMRKQCRTSGNYYKNLRSMVKNKRIGNCTDLAAISAYDINNSHSNYKANIVYASILKKDEIYNHAAVIVKSKFDNDKLKPDTIVLDN